MQSNGRPVFTLNAVYMSSTRLSGSLSPVLLPACASIDKSLRQRKCEYSCHTFQSICPFQLAWEQCFVSINKLSHVGHVTPRTNRLTRIVLHRNGCIAKEHDQRNAKWNWQQQTFIFRPSVTEVKSLYHFRFLSTSTGCQLWIKMAQWIDYFTDISKFSCCLLTGATCDRSVHSDIQVRCNINVSNTIYETL